MNFSKSHAGETLGKAKNLEMGKSSIASMLFIIGVKAYNRLSILQIDVQTWQYAKVRTTGPCLALHTSSNIKQNRASYGPNIQM